MRARHIGMVFSVCAVIAACNGSHGKGTWPNVTVAFRHPPRSVKLTNSDHLVFSGHWRSSGPPKSLSMPVVNVVEGDCDRSAGICTESVGMIFTSLDRNRAALEPGELQLLRAEYVIKEWDDSTILAVRPHMGPVKSATIQINVNSSVVQKTYIESDSQPPLVIHYVLE
jgi:hypothetical protein